MPAHPIIYIQHLLAKWSHRVDIMTALVAAATNPKAIIIDVSSNRHAVGKTAVSFLLRQFFYANGFNNVLMANADGDIDSFVDKLGVPALARDKAKSLNDLVVPAQPSNDLFDKLRGCQVLVYNSVRLEANSAIKPLDSQILIDVFNDPSSPGCRKFAHAIRNYFTALGVAHVGEHRSCADRKFQESYVSFVNQSSKDLPIVLLDLNRSTYGKGQPYFGAMQGKVGKGIEPVIAPKKVIYDAAAVREHFFPVLGFAQVSDVRCFQMMQTPSAVVIDVQCNAAPNGQSHLAVLVMLCMKEFGFINVRCNFDEDQLLQQTRHMVDWTGTIVITDSLRDHDKMPDDALSADVCIGVSSPVSRMLGYSVAKAIESALTLNGFAKVKVVIPENSEPATEGSENKFNDLRLTRKGRPIVVLTGKKSERARPVDYGNFMSANRPGN